MTASVPSTTDKLAGRASVPDRLLDILRCPSCGGGLAVDASSLRCNQCGAQYPIRDAIPRFVNVPAGKAAVRTQASFGYEWTHFHEWEPSGEQNFQDYFEGLDTAALAEARVLDAGCGMGRHARQIAGYARHVVAADFSAAIEQAARNTSSCGNVDCVQADLNALPFAPAAFDYAYSIGVLHHLTNTRAALRSVVERVRTGGRVRVYLYWKRHGLVGALLRGVTVARTLTTRMPFPLLRAVSWCLSVGLMAGVVFPYRVLSRAGVRIHDRWPLFVYTKYPFRVLYNDQFDRFSAPIEQRFDRDEVIALLESVGLTDVHVYPRFGWVAEGVRTE